MDSIPEKSAEIEDAFMNEDFSFYTVKVHALKSGARIVGLGGLSAKAEALEDAGKSKNIDFIRANTGELLNEYRSYETKLDFLASNTADESKPPADPADIADAYDALYEVAQMMDYDSAEMILESMKEYSLPPEDKARFHDIEKALRAIKWDEICDILRKD